MELSKLSVAASITHASGALGIWLTAISCFLESVPLRLDYALLSEPVASYLPLRIRQGLLDTYSIYLNDYQNPDAEEEQRVINAMRNAKK